MLNIHKINSKWLVFIAVSIVAVMINLDMTVVNLALVTIGKSLHASLSQMQWVINIYMLTNIIFIIFAGKLADIFNKKIVYLSGVIIFFVASIFAGFAVNQEMLIFARAIQGIGFAFTLTLGIVIATLTFPSERRGFILGCYMTVAGLAQAFGPTIGGLILQFSGWRWIFFINIPLSLLALFFIQKFYHPERSAGGDKKVNFSDVLMLGSGLSLLVLALNKLGDWGLNSYQFIILLLSGLLILVFFYFKEKFSQSPLLNFKLFNNSSYLLINIIRCIYMFCCFSIIFSLSIYMQNVVGFTPLRCGLILFCMTLVSGLISPIVGIALDRIGYTKPLFVAILLSLFALLLFVNLRENLSFSVLIFGLILLGISMPIVGSASPAIVMRNIPKEFSGVGMGTFYTSAFLGSAMGVALTGSMVDIFSNNYFYQNFLKIHDQLFSANQISYLKNVANGAHSIYDYSTYFSQADIVVVLPYLKQSFVYGFSIVMWCNIAITLIALVLCRFIVKTQNNFS